MSRERTTFRRFLRHRPRELFSSRGEKSGPEYRHVLQQGESPVLTHNRFLPLIGQGFTILDNSFGRPAVSYSHSAYFRSRSFYFVEFKDVQRDLIIGNKGERERVRLPKTRFSHVSLQFYYYIIIT